MTPEVDRTYLLCLAHAPAAISSPVGTDQFQAAHSSGMCEVRRIVIWDDVDPRRATEGATP